MRLRKRMRNQAWMRKTSNRISFWCNVIVYTSMIATRYVQAQEGCCSAWWFAPEGLVVTRLESTLLIPTLSPSPTEGIHFIWTGLETRPGSFVLQSVISDQQIPGFWAWGSWWGPDNFLGSGSGSSAKSVNTSGSTSLESLGPKSGRKRQDGQPPSLPMIDSSENGLADGMNGQGVQPQTSYASPLGYQESPFPPLLAIPGDTLHTIIVLNTSTNHYTTSYALTPGLNHPSSIPGFGFSTEGVAYSLAGEVDAGFDISGVGVELTDVVFEIELQSNPSSGGVATWDFGSVEWRDVIIEVGPANPNINNFGTVGAAGGPGGDGAGNSGLGDTSWCTATTLGSRAFGMRVEGAVGSVLLAAREGDAGGYRGGNGGTGEGFVIVGSRCVIEKVVFISPDP